MEWSVFDIPHSDDSGSNIFGRRKKVDLTKTTHSKMNLKF